MLLSLRLKIRQSKGELITSLPYFFYCACTNDHKANLTISHVIIFIIEALLSRCISFDQGSFGFFIVLFLQLIIETLKDIPGQTCLKLERNEKQKVYSSCHNYGFIVPVSFVKDKLKCHSSI